MTAAFSGDARRRKSNWLGRYLDVEKDYSIKLRDALRDTVTGVDEAFGALGTSNISSRVRRTQIALAHREIRSQIGQLFGETGNLIRNGRQDAAVAAVNARLYDQRGVLSRLFPDRVERTQYADSLRQSAKRNIEAVIARTLDSERPLSQSVYKTRALANGQVSRAINNALARGDSAKDLAKSVRTLIDPDVPGGVSYAAQRLGRTEINNAFHAQSIHDAQQIPWVQQMEWHLSKVHEPDLHDPCESYAIQKTFNVENVPEKPHPNCRCYVTPVQDDYETFEAKMLAGQYDPYLDELLGPEHTIAHRTSENLRVTEDLGEYVEELEEFPDAIMDRLATGDFTKSTADIERNIVQANRIREISPKTLTKGFSSPDLDPKAAVEVADAFEDFMVKYPGVQVDGFGFGYEDTHWGSTAVSSTSNEAFAKGQSGFSSIVTINSLWGQDHSLTVAQMAKNVLDGWHTKGSQERPFYSTTLHELAHAMTNSFGTEEHELKPAQIEKALKAAFVKANPKVKLETKGDWLHARKRWLAKQLSGYSFEDVARTRIDYDEAVAEAFDAVERLGAKASHAERALHKVLINRYKEVQKRPNLYE